LLTLFDVSADFKLGNKDALPLSTAEQYPPRVHIPPATEDIDEPLGSFFEHGLV